MYAYSGYSNSLLVSSNKLCTKLYMYIYGVHVQTTSKQFKCTDGTSHIGTSSTGIRRKEYNIM